VTLDWVTAAVCAVIIFATLAEDRHWASYSWQVGFWFRALLAVGLALPVAIRRRDPVRALILSLAGCTVILVLGDQISRGPFIPLALVLFTVAATCTRKVAIAGLAASLALLLAQGLVLSATGRGPGPAAGIGLVLIIVWMVGILVLQRRSYAARMREQVTSAAVTEERLRIARELHDVVAHSMTVVAVQAGFGEYVFEREPAEARAALGAIQRVTTEALADMQRLLGVLRQGDAAGSGADRNGAARRNGGGTGRPLQLAPAPGLADLDRLVATTAGAGVRVEVARGACRAGIPAAIDQSAFRIVQEALTNVVKHSGADSCQVIVGCRGGDLCLEITDPGEPAHLAAAAAGASRAGGVTRAAAAGGAGPADGTGGTGHGIIGMRERVSLLGGEFSAAPLPGRGFRVMARFPLDGPPDSGASR
jgi:signal transduction histidine kinase